MRLNRYLAWCGLESRRGAEKLILAGRVRVNGRTVRALATFVEPGRDRVEVGGRPVTPPREATYWVLHKPEGVVTTADDPHGRPTALSLVPAEPRVFPVGRLDMDSSGLLLLTDDGNLAHRVLHPRYRLEKEYRVLAEGSLSDDALAPLREGILLEGETRPTAPASILVTRRRPHRTGLTIVLHEGRKRQIRRMLEAVGHPVIQLQRIRIGPILLGSLPAGVYRAMTREEIRALRRELESPADREPHPSANREPHDQKPS